MKRSGGKPFTIVVEGNIGSGKSTFLSQLALEHPEVFETHAEPVHKWQNVNGHNLLDLMYKDPSRWSLTFQSYVQLTMMELHLQKCAKSVKMIERSIYSGRHCFIENLHRSGKMPSSEYSVLDEWYRFLTSSDVKSKSKFDMSIDLIIYLRTTPEVAWERVKARARSEEKVIPLDYIRELHELHEEWLLKSDKSSLPAEVLVIDADVEISENPDMYTKHITSILQRSSMSPAGSIPVVSPKKVLGLVNRET